MHRTFPVQPRFPKECFKAIVQPNQPYGELPPEFVHKFYHDLPNDCQLNDINEMQHYLTLNKDHIVPHFSNGWSELLNHYNIQQVKEIWFVYCGGGTFLISIGNVLNSTDEYPSFIRNSTKPNETTYFDVTLSEYAAVGSQLDFGDYLRSTNLKFVLLCNQNMKFVQSSVLLRGPPKRSTKNGCGWKQFCILKGYQNGDTIRFKFPGTLSCNLIHVWKI